MDSKFPHLLLWMYQKFVHRVPDNRVVIEGLAYIVGFAEIHTEPVWVGKVSCFSVVDQDHEVITFTLRGAQ